MFAFVNRRDIEFNLFELLDVESLCAAELYAKYDATMFRQVVETAYQIATDHFAPHAARADTDEPHFDGTRVHIIPEIKQALDAYVEAGLMGAVFAVEHGGLQLPITVAQAANAMFYAANISTAAYPMLTVGAANLIAAFGSSEQKATYLKPMVQGRWFGTMCLSEPQAGSSLADIRTRATPHGDNTYLIRGSKMWISGGEHDLSENIIHMVLARIDNAPPGVKGISLFIVPKYRVGADGRYNARNGVALAGLNHKMGYRGTVNTLLNFGESNDCIGYLVGEAHRGLSYMFQMMNEARIAVGLGATMCGYAGYLASLQYARERPQGRHPNSKDPTSPQTPIIEHADVRRLLMTQKCYVEGALSLVLYCAHVIDRIRTVADAPKKLHLELLVDVLTPIVKSWPSEFCLEANKLAIQVLGGYGYTRDYPVERLYRDNRLNAIHEGTHGIQGLDLLGRKVVMQDGAALAALGAELEADVEAGSRHVPTAQYAKELLRAWDTSTKVTDALVVRQKTNPRDGLADATVYLDMLGHVVVAWMWLRQALAALRAQTGKDGAFYEGKIAACRFFFERELPKIYVQADLLLAGHKTHIELNVESL